MSRKSVSALNKLKARNNNESELFQRSSSQFLGPQKPQTLSTHLFQYWLHYGRFYWIPYSKLRTTYQCLTCGKKCRALLHSSRHFSISLLLIFADNGRKCNWCQNESMNVLNTAQSKHFLKNRKLKRLLNALRLSTYSLNNSFNSPQIPTVKRKGDGRKRPGSNFNDCTSILLGGGGADGKPQKILISIASICAEIWALDISNTKQMLHPPCSDARWDVNYPF